MARRSALLLALLLLAVAGCKTVAPTRAKPAAPIAVKATPDVPGAQAGAGLVANNGGNLIANNGSSLLGVAKAPASLVTDNGSGLVTDNGSGYRLADVAQVPVPNARVRLLDAAGQPVADAKGQALETITDATGHYGFTGELPARNLVVAVDLGAKGALQGIAEPDGAAARHADLDLVSTFTTAYILDQYVRSQPDPLATLDKLPADVEADTRAKAAAALAAGKVPTPAALTDAAAVAAVATLRQADPSFDAQLEAVRKLLVVVGQSDLGNGRPGTQVRLRAIQAVLAAPGGGAWFTTASDHRVWRLLPDGTLQTAAGVGTARPGVSVDGVPAVQAGLVSPFGLALDAKGRLLILEHVASGADRLTRLNADGTLTQLKTGAGSILAVVPQAGDAVKLLLAPGPDSVGAYGLLDDDPAATPAPVQAPSWFSLTPGGALQDLGMLDPARFGALVGAKSFGVAADGRVTLGVPGEAAKAFRLDATGFDGTVVTEGEDGIEHLAVASNGALVEVTAGGTTRRLVLDDGTAKTLVDDLPAITFLDPLAGATVLADGSVDLVQRATLLASTAKGTLATVAGQQAPPDGDATDVAIDTPNGMAVGAGGELYMSDKTGEVVLRIDAHQHVSVLAGTGKAATTGDGGPAMAASVNTPRALRMDAAGSLYVLQGGLGETVRKVVDLAGTPTISTAFHSPGDLYIRDMSITADGKCFLALKGRSNGPTSVVRIAPDGTVLTVVPPGADEGQIVAVAPDGSLWMLVGQGGARTLVRWTEAGGTQTIKTDARFAANYPNDSNGLAVTADGRAIITLWGLHQVWVYDPKTDTTTQVAGVGGTHFTGDGVDDGIEAPRYPTIGPAGELLFSDTHHHQVKRIPKGEY